MNVSERLLRDGILTEEKAKAIKAFDDAKPMSVHWELKTILYLGIMLLVSGISILVYKNIDTIGHQVILASIFAACLGCFYYAFKHKKPFTREEVTYESPLFDYVVLLACLLLGVFLGYLQYQYTVFGTYYGLATLIPTIVYFWAAYSFDHKGILSLGITGLAAWAGISVRPSDLLSENDLTETGILMAGLAVGITLAAFSYYSDKQNIKKHFGFSYNNFAANILFIVTLAALFDKDYKVVSFLFLLAVGFYYLKYAIREQSFFFLFLAVLYTYIGFTYVFFNFLAEIGNEFSFVLGFLFLAASCVGVVLFFVFYKRILKINSHDSLQ